MNHQELSFLYFLLFLRLDQIMVHIFHNKNRLLLYYFHNLKYYFNIQGKKYTLKSIILSLLWFFEKMIYI